MIRNYIKKLDSWGLGRFQERLANILSKIYFLLLADFLN